MVTLEATHTVPLSRDPDGVIRITGSRVTLDSIVDEFERGATPEQIQEDFPSLTLREIHGVVAYYLASAAEQGRVIVTHDVNTLAGHAYEGCVAGLPMPGVIAIPKSLPIGQAIEELLLLVECVEPPELEGLVVHLSL